MNDLFDEVVGNESRLSRTVKIPAGVSVTRETRRRNGRFSKGGARVVPHNEEMVAWLDASTPGWYSTLFGEEAGKAPKRAIVFATSAHAALFKMFWT